MSVLSPPCPDRSLLSLAVCRPLLPRRVATRIRTAASRAPPLGGVPSVLPCRPSPSKATRAHTGVPCTAQMTQCAPRTVRIRQQAYVQRQAHLQVLRTLQCRIIEAMPRQPRQIPLGPHHQAQQDRHLGRHHRGRQDHRRHRDIHRCLRHRLDRRHHHYRDQWQTRLRHQLAAQLQAVTVQSSRRTAG